jgi:flagellar protein FlaJ
MSDGFEYSFDESGPPVEYGIPSRVYDRPISREEKGRMRREYGWIRTYFKLRPSRYQQVQRNLNQARMGLTYDEYLARSTLYAFVVAAVGVVLGVLLTVQLSNMGVFAGLENPLSVRGDLVSYIGQNRTLFGGTALALGLGLVLGAVTWFTRYYYPVTVVSSRRQNIDIVLPHAIVYMYALSHGGMSLLEVMRSLASASETYGEVSNEFEMIVNDIDLFGTDMYTALQNARNITPSENLEQFLDDMISVLDSGGDVTIFLEEESETYLREAEDEQENFLETLSLLAEVFVVGFVAAPLFLIVTLVVISLIGGNTISQISMLVYLVMPIAMLAFLFLLDVLGQPYEQVRTSPVLEPLDEEPVEAADIEDDPRFTPYRRRKQVRQAVAFLREPFHLIRARPVLTLAVSVPVALAVVAGLVLGGVYELSFDALVEQPIQMTTALIVVPFLIVAVPLSVFFELRRHREQEIANRFPDTLNILASANKMGIRLTEALDLVSRWSSGVVSKELRTVRNDIEWNHDVTKALIAFGARLHVPQLSRTMKLLAEGIRSTGDLSRVLSIAAEDTRNRAKLERARQRELSSYIAVVIIGFLVYLLVIVLLDASYLQPLGEIGSEAPASADSDVPLSFVNVPVNTYRTIFFHSALIQAVGSGMLAGKLSDNDIFSGLKYSIALVLIALVAFMFI